MNNLIFILFASFHTLPAHAAFINCQLTDNSVAIVNKAVEIDFFARRVRYRDSMQVREIPLSTFGGTEGMDDEINLQFEAPLTDRNKIFISISEASHQGFMKIFGDPDFFAELNCK